MLLRRDRSKDFVIKVRKALIHYGRLAYRRLISALRKFDFWLVLGTWALAVVGYITMKDQHKALERQLSEMQFEQRAWLYASGVEMAAPMSFDVNGLRMTFAHMVRNTGKNPAVQVFVNAEAKIDELPNPEWSRRVCSINSGDLGVSIFPGADSAPLVYTIYVAKHELEKSEIRDTSTGRRFVPPINVMFCVTYKDAATNKVGRTPYAFKLQKKIGPLWDSEDLPTNDVVLQLSPLPTIPPD